MPLSPKKWQLMILQRVGQTHTDELFVPKHPCFQVEKPCLKCTNQQRVAAVVQSSSTDTHVISLASSSLPVWPSEGAGHTLHHHCPSAES